ncbi:hypothetical protein ACOKFD_04665 [Flagellimonas sp. S174]|uniref:hypothetical protein n=1 Tax=Flagellimonas sp. S174 TaxID=3410790 RepID=UPI002623441B|nr:hypothetical protein [uncultured Allomuricauda sp.]
MKDYEILYLTSGVISTIFQLVIIVATGILLFKKRSVATGLMFVGSLLSVAFYGFSLFGSTLVARQGAEDLVKFNAIFSIVNQIPHILFAVGLLLFIIQYTKKENDSKNI